MRVRRRTTLARELVKQVLASRGDVCSVYIALCGRGARRITASFIMYEPTIKMIFSRWHQELATSTNKRQYN
jgi:hypothetical protein